MFLPAEGLGCTLLSAAGAVTANTAETNPAIVVITGLVLVFAILVLLTLIFTLTGKLFSAMDTKRKAKEEAAKTVQEAAAAAPMPAAAPAVAPPQAAPTVQPGIPPEVIAAISAAVASIDDGRYTLQSVTTTPAPPPQKGRSQWGLAGVISYTEPF